MLGLPVWLVQLIIAFLKETGAISAAGALSAKLIVKVETKLNNLKYYHKQSDFPDHKNSGL